MLSGIQCIEFLLYCIENADSGMDLPVSLGRLYGRVGENRIIVVNECI